MIVPITQAKNGKTETIGAADVVPVDGEFVVEFYLRPEFALSDKVKTDLTKELIALAKRQFGDLSIG